MALFLVPAMLSNSSTYAARKPLDAAAIRERIAAHCVGQGVRVTLTDKTEAIGIIVSIGDRSFALKANNADQPRSIEYAQVTGVRGEGLSTAVKVGVFAGIEVVVLVVALVSIAKREAGLAKPI